MSARRVQRDEAGAVLIIAMVVLIMLTMVGLMAIQIVAVEVEVVGAERSADNALYIAEAGLQWGLQTLDGYNFVPGNPDYAPILALPTVSDAGPFAPAQIQGWYELHGGQISMPYGDGNFRVVVNVMPPPDEDTLLVRSFGISGSPQEGAKRLLEVAVVPR